MKLNKIENKNETKELRGLTEKQYDDIYNYYINKDKSIIEAKIKEQRKEAKSYENLANKIKKDGGNYKPLLEGSIQRIGESFVLKDILKANDKGEVELEDFEEEKVELLRGYYTLLPSYTEKDIEKRVERFKELSTTEQYKWLEQLKENRKIINNLKMKGEKKMENKKKGFLYNAKIRGEKRKKEQREEMLNSLNKAKETYKLLDIFDTERLLQFSNFKEESEFYKEMKKEIEELLLKLKNEQLKEKLIIKEVIDNNNYKVIAYKLDNKDVLFEVYKEEEKIEQGNLPKIRKFFRTKVRDKYGKSNVLAKQELEVLLDDLGDIDRATTLKFIYGAFKKTKDKMELEYKEIK